MGDRLPDEAWEVTSPSGLAHLTEGSGYTFCGKDCAPWERAGQVGSAPRGRAAGLGGGDRRPGRRGTADGSRAAPL